MKFQIDQIFKLDREVKDKRNVKMNKSRHFCYLDILGGRINLNIIDYNLNIIG